MAYAFSQLYFYLLIVLLDFNQTNTECEKDFFEFSFSFLCCA